MLLALYLILSEYARTTCTSAACGSVSACTMLGVGYLRHGDVRVVGAVLRRHLVGVAAQPVRAQRGRVREALVAPLARQRLVARMRVHMNLV